MGLKWRLLSATVHSLRSTLSFGNLHKGTLGRERCSSGVDFSPLVESRDDEPVGVLLKPGSHWTQNGSATDHKCSCSAAVQVLLSLQLEDSFDIVHLDSTTTLEKMTIVTYTNMIKNPCTSHRLPKLLLFNVAFYFEML